MEIIGIYKDDKLIKIPEELHGKYFIEIYKDGSFSFRPSEGQINNLITRFVVNDPKNLICPVFFNSEKRLLSGRKEWSVKMGEYFVWINYFHPKELKYLGVLFHEIRTCEILR